MTALALYGLSELNGYLKEKWFPAKLRIVRSEDGTRGFRLSDQGEPQTAILKPFVEIKSAKLTDSRNHPRFDLQNYPFYYQIYFKYHVHNGIENKQRLLLNRAVAVFDINGVKSKIKLNGQINDTIGTGRGQGYSINDESFVGSSKEIKSATLRIQCKFENYADLVSQEFNVPIK